MKTFAKMRLRTYFRNPLTDWGKWIWTKFDLEIKHRRKRIHLGYMAEVYNCKFGGFNSIHEYTRMSNVDIGSCSYVARGSEISNAQIGKFCSIGPGVKCGGGYHPTRMFVSTHPAFYSHTNAAKVSFSSLAKFNEIRETSIGNDVWIGANVIILDGVSIGDGAIVGAGAVIAKDVPPYAVVVGVPGRVIRFRFSSQQIDGLIKMRWWDKDLPWIMNHADEYENIDVFSKHFATEVILETEDSH